jgi:hypothetical protein
MSASDMRGGSGGGADDKDRFERGKWNPSPEEFDRYIAREFEMALVNCRTHGFGTTLHSAWIIAKVQLSNAAVNELSRQGQELKMGY